MQPIAGATPDAAAPLRAVETEYRGFRFRSRTEARYAVSDAAGIVWQYEAEGFCLNGTRYLPDFFLPELKTYVEVKPTKEAAQESAPLLLALKEASGCDALFAVGSPTADSSAGESPKNFFRCYRYKDTYLCSAVPTQCPFCNRLRFSRGDCDCPGEVRVLKWPWAVRETRLLHALGEAQRARFEFGETGRPRPYTSAITYKRRVYAAGAIFQEMGPSEEADCLGTNEGIEPWRADVFNCSPGDLSSETGPTAGRFVYAGPTIVDRHGGAYEGLADQCLDEVSDADLLFAWIDREETIGTLVEIGAACAANKPVFAAFASRGLSERFYFVEQLAAAAVVTPNVAAAWDLLSRWRGNTA